MSLLPPSLPPRITFCILGFNKLEKRRRKKDEEEVGAGNFDPAAAAAEGGGGRRRRWGSHARNTEWFLTGVGVKKKKKKCAWRRFLGWRRQPPLPLIFPFLSKSGISTDKNVFIAFPEQSIMHVQKWYDRRGKCDSDTTGREEF